MTVRVAASAAVEPVRAGASQTRRLVAATTAAAVLAGGLVWGAAQISAARASTQGASSSDQLASEQSQRRSVQLAVSSFAANLTTYSVADIERYKSRLTPLMTSGFAKSFGLAVDGIVAEVKATRMKSVGDVVQTAVSAMGADRATALAVADVRVHSRLGDRVRHFRWKVTLVREAGAWLVDAFEPVA